MSRGDEALLIILAIVFIVFVLPSGEFILMFLRRLSLAGIAALSALIVLLLVRSMRR